MALHPRRHITYHYLICLTSFVAISLVLIIVSGLLSTWCVQYRQHFSCYSLLQSNQCLIKLIITGVIICLVLSLFMFVILIVGQEYIHYSAIIKGEYQLVARYVNIFALLLAIILIIIVLLQWFHPSAPSKNTSEVLIPFKKDPNRISKEEPKARSETVSEDNSSHSKIIFVRDQLNFTRHRNFNHISHLLLAAFIILIVTLLGFVIGHRVSN